MNIKFITALVCIVTSTATARAQSGDYVSERKLYLDFGGSVGVFIPFDQVKGQKALYGSNAMTNLQLNYHQYYFARLQFSQTTVDFQSQNSFGSVLSSVNAKANSSNLGLSFGYQRNFGRWQPYVLLGGGASFIDVPATTVNVNANTIGYSTSSSTCLYLNAGAGINYRVSKSFVLFLEGQASTIPNLPKNSITHLNGISALIGIKAPL